MKKAILLFIFVLGFSNLINAQCTCGTTPTENRWDGIGFYVGSKPLAKYPCGYQFTVKTSENIKFVSGGYNCIDKYECKASISAKLYRNGIGINSYLPFLFNEVITFPSPGNYKLILYAKCKDNKCLQCVYYFTVL